MERISERCTFVIMGQRVSRSKKAAGSECVYSHPSTPLQTTANTPNPCTLDESRAGIGEVDGGGREEREKGVRKKRTFWRRLFCFHFSHPRAGKGEKVKQSENQEQEAEARPSRRSTDGKSYHPFVYIGALYTKKNHFINTP